MCCAQNWNKIENKWMAIARPGKGSAYAYPWENKKQKQIKVSKIYLTYSKIYLTAWGLSTPYEMIIKCCRFGADDWDNFLQYGVLWFNQKWKPTCVPDFGAISVISIEPLVLLKYGRKINRGSQQPSDWLGLCNPYRLQLYTQGSLAKDINHCRPTH